MSQRECAGFNRPPLVIPAEQPVRISPVAVRRIGPHIRAAPAIVVPSCDTPLTSCWSTSKSGVKHPYYLCFAKGCPSYRKSIRRDVLEGEFEDTLQSLKPTEGLFALVKQMFADAWAQRQQQVDADKAILKRDLVAIDKKIEGLLDRIVDADSGTLVTAYETRLKKLEREKLMIAEKLDNQHPKQDTFEHLFEHACVFLSSPWKLWESSNLALRRAVLKLAFAERISYCRETGVRTPKNTIPFKVLGGFSAKRCEVADRGGFEPPTP